MSNHQKIPSQLQEQLNQMFKEIMYIKPLECLLPIKVPKDIKNSELGSEMFDDIAEDNTGNTSLDNINMTVTNILHSDALNGDSVEANSQLSHVCRNLNTKFNDNIPEYTKFKNNIRHTSSVCEGQEQVKDNSSVPKPEVSKPKRGRGQPCQKATKHKLFYIVLLKCFIQMPFFMYLHNV